MIKQQLASRTKSMEKPTKKKKNTVKAQKTAKTQTPKVEWFVLRGFKKDDKDTTGFLAFNQKKSRREDLYHIVEDVDDAMRFPSKNIYNAKGFGTPKQWLEFFKGEYELADWQFHLVKVKG